MQWLRQGVGGCRVCEKGMPVAVALCLLCRVVGGGGACVGVPCVEQLTCCALLNCVLLPVLAVLLLLLLHVGVPVVPLSLLLDSRRRLPSAAGLAVDPPGWLCADAARGGVSGCSM